MTPFLEDRRYAYNGFRGGLLSRKQHVHNRMKHL
jgi:hypothetical protein